MDRRPAQRTCPDTVDELKHLFFAKVRVAGSNPVFRSNCCLLAGLMRTDRPIEFTFSARHRPSLAHHGTRQELWKRREDCLVSGDQLIRTQRLRPYGSGLGEVPLADAHGVRQPMGCPVRAEDFGGTRECSRRPSVYARRSPPRPMVRPSSLFGHRPQSPIVVRTSWRTALQSELEPRRRALRWCERVPTGPSHLRLLR